MSPTVPGGISCREVVELVTEYLDGTLDAETAERMRVHLEACPYCVEYVEQIRATGRIAAVAAAELELRPDRDHLLALFKDIRRSA